jgi:hypothetical protein
MSAQPFQSWLGERLRRRLSERQEERPSSKSERRDKDVTEGDVALPGSWLSARGLDKLPAST